MIELVLLDAAYLRGRGTHPGFADPEGFLDGADDVIALRLQQIDANPAVAPWLLRAIVAGGVAVGFIGCHAEPDAQGRVEIGYEIHPSFRRRGYATAAVAAQIAWAAQQGVRVVRASIRPDNAPSLALIARFGFTRVGEQIDDIDGLEWVFEKSLS